MRIRHRSKQRRAVDAVVTYLKFKAISKAAKTVRRLVAKRFAKRPPVPAKVLPVLPVVAGVGVAGAVAARKRRHHDGTPGSGDTTADERLQTTAA